MNLLITFIVLVVIGLSGAAGIGILVDRMTSSFVSLVVFFPLLALATWIAWRLSVKLTEPKVPTST
jgi:uncharacterized membrane protein